MRRVLSITGICAVAAIFACLATAEVRAFPTFARKYKTSCSTCHYAFPRLNKFGRAFYNNGLRYPGDDKDYAKEEAVSLGSESYKRVFPDAIWPADIPGTSPVSFRWVSRIHYQPSKSGTGEEFSFENPHELEAFMPGTIGERLSFIFELEWEHTDEFGYGGWLDYRFSNPFHLRLGNIEYLPVHEHTRLTREHYNYGDFRKLNNNGMEIWGAVNGADEKGGFLYSVGVLNGENDGENLDLNSNKDVFARASYKIGGMGVLGSAGPSETSAFWKDNSLTFGAFGHLGKNADNSKNRNFGGRIDAFYEDLNVFGLAMLSQKKTASTALQSAAANDDWADTKRAFAEADYVVYPWLIPLLRFEYTKEEDKDAVKQLVPAIVVMARANVKVIPTGRIDLDNSDNNRFNIQVEAGF